MSGHGEMLREGLQRRRGLSVSPKTDNHKLRFSLSAASLQHLCSLWGIRGGGVFAVIVALIIMIADKRDTGSRPQQGVGVFVLIRGKDVPPLKPQCLSAYAQRAWWKTHEKIFIVIVFAYNLNLERCPCWFHKGQLTTTQQCNMLKKQTREFAGARWFCLVHLFMSKFTASRLDTLQYSLHQTLACWNCCAKTQDLQ